jgi:hypothetical protein
MNKQVGNPKIPIILWYLILQDEVISESVPGQIGD